MTRSAAVNGQLRILLLEDNEPDAYLVIHAMNAADADARIDRAATRRQFTELLASHDYDLVLADYRLPDWTGMDALREMRRLGFDMPLIIVTGTLGDEPAAECIKGGAADYVLKGTLARLPIAVNRAVEDKRARNESRHNQAMMEQAQQERREHEERFLQLADNIDELFFVMDAQHQETLYINPAYERIWGRSRQSLYDDPRSFVEAVSPDDRGRLLDYMARIERGEQAGKLEYRVVQPSGNVRWLLTHAVPIRNERGEVYRVAGVALDITDKRTLESQFRQAQKMEAVGRLAGGIAHDFNNLLTVIMSYTDMLSEGIPATDMRSDDLDQIRKAAVAASSLTRQLLAFSRQQVIEPRHINLNDVVSSSEKMLRRLIGEDVALATALTDDPVAVLIDPSQLEQVIMNLAVNARDAMPTGGKITIETARVKVDADYALDHWPAVPGRFAMLAVTDTGTGMSEETRSQVFEPFFTTKEVGKGTGLGLSTAYGIIKQSNGFIWVYSEPDHGTTFKIYLPLVDEPAPKYEGQAELLPLPLGTETVLLAEDAAAVRAAARQILERSGYTVLEAPTGRDALIIASKRQTPIHLLLTDVVMPEMSGSELAEQFAEFRPASKVLYMSGYTDDAIVRHGILRPGIAYLQKPFSPDALARKVREVLDNGRAKPAALRVNAQGIDPSW